MNYKIVKTTNGFEDEEFAIQNNIYAVLLYVDKRQGEFSGRDTHNEYLCIDIMNDKEEICPSWHVIGCIEYYRKDYELEDITESYDITCSEWYNNCVLSAQYFLYHYFTD